ncbi:hypothetical protein [Vallicoccus soli]|uniref:Uncharacterized protein n=1 Tax=Vallicoccus soli TaxID=2339232 RepID=A0A3A3YV60_9ACTN|nr:hypothetical protein [Vallicoccus soli]RJK95441.1 hypothetical protein D5H78_12375 [Vallicoccus soli]
MTPTSPEGTAPADPRTQPDGPTAAGEHDRARDAQRTATRASLLPEEGTVGSDDPQEQAEVVLEDSEARTEVPDAAPTTVLERRGSEETADPLV